MSITLNQFNVKTRKIDKYIKKYEIFLDGTNSPFNKVILKTGEVQLIEGVLTEELQN